MNRQSVDLGKGPVGKLLFSLSLPTITSQIVNMLYNLVDRVYIGHMQPADTVGALALTGVGVCLPIIMVTAKSSELDTVRGLDCGADDYITKPFGIMEFLSRVRAALRRSAPEEKQNVYAFHEILLDNARHSVTVSGVNVDLTYKEYSLLRLLLEHTNLVVTRETILQVVWGTDISVESRTVDMHIRTLRKKLGDAGKYICTVRKVGYKLADSEEEPEE